MAELSVDLGAVGEGGAGDRDDLTAAPGRGGVVVRTAAPAEPERPDDTDDGDDEHTGADQQGLAPPGRSVVGTAPGIDVAFAVLRELLHDVRPVSPWRRGRRPGRR